MRTSRAPSRLLGAFLLIWIGHVFGKYDVSAGDTFCEARSTKCDDPGKPEPR